MEEYKVNLIFTPLAAFISCHHYLFLDSLEIFVENLS